MRGLAERKTTALKITRIKHAFCRQFTPMTAPIWADVVTDAMCRLTPGMKTRHRRGFFPHPPFGNLLTWAYALCGRHTGTLSSSASVALGSTAAAAATVAETTAWSFGGNLTIRVAHVSSLYLPSATKSRGCVLRLLPL